MTAFFRASIVAFLFVSNFALAELTGEEISKFATQEIIEIKAFYSALETLQASDERLKALRFKPGQVALAGGFCRELTAYLKQHPGAKNVSMKDVHSASRDLDLVVMTPLANPEDQDYVTSKIKELLVEQVQVRGGVRLRNLDVATLEQKKNGGLYERQGFDSISQALISPKGVFDVAEVMGLEPRINALHSLTTGIVDYQLPAKGEGQKDGVLTLTVEFMNQLLEVFRILKIQAELRGDVTLTPEAQINIRKVLSAYAARKAEVESFIAKDARGSYFKNRFADVVGGMLDESGGVPSPEFDKWNADYQLSELSVVKQALNNAKIKANVLTEITTGSKRTLSKAFRVLDEGGEAALGKSLFYSPRTKKLFRGGFGGARTEIVIPQGKDKTGAITTNAYSGKTAVVEPVVLPLDKYEVIKAEPLNAQQTIALVKNPTYSNLVLINTDGTDAEMRFMNLRSFSSRSDFSDQVRAGNGKAGGGAPAPMIPIVSFAVDDPDVYALRGDRNINKLVLKDGTLRFDESPFKGPRGAPVVSMTSHEGKLFFLQENGDLSANDGNETQFLMNGVSGFMKDDAGRLVAIVEKTKGKWVARVLDTAKKGFHEIALPKAPAGSAAIQVKGQVVALFQPDAFQPKAPSPEVLAALAAINRPISAELEQVRALRAKWDSDATSQKLFDDFFRPDFKPQEFTKDTGPIASMRAIGEKYADYKTRIAEAFYLRLLIELKRGKEASFDFTPNSYVLAALIDGAKALDDGSHHAAYKALADADTLNNVLLRDESALRRYPNEQALPNWTSYILASLSELAKKTECQLAPIANQPPKP